MKTSTLFKLAMIISILTSAIGIALAKPTQTLNFKRTKDSTLCLEINGKLAKTSSRAKKTYTVELLNNNEVIETAQVKEGKSFQFSLKGNEWYAVKIKDGGCEPKLISINTTVPQEIHENYVHVLSFEVDHLITSQESKMLCADALDFPIALFHFDSKLNEFNYNEEYRGNITKKLLHPIVIHYN